MSQKDSRYAWLLVVVTALLTGVGAGSVMSISVFLKPLIADFGWLRSQTSFAYTAGVIATGIGGIAMGYLSDRFSLRVVVLVGVVFMGISMLLLASQTALWQFYLFYCMLGGLGSALDVPLLANIGSWFERNKGFALGLTTAGRSLGQGLVPFAGGLLIADFGWRDAYLVLAIFCLLVLLPLAWLVRTPPGHAAAKAAARSASPESQRQAFPISPGIAIAWLSIAAVFCCICMGTTVVHSVAMAQDMGIDARHAASIMLVINFAGFFGRIAFGKLTDHIGGVGAYLGASTMQTSLVFWFTQVETFDGFCALAAVFGFGMSAVMTCLMVCVREMAPVHRRGVCTGIVILFGGIGMGIGGYQGGLFYDLTGDYLLSFANSTLAGVVNMAIVGALLYYSNRTRVRLATATPAFAT